MVRELADNHVLVSRRAAFFWFPSAAMLTTLITALSVYYADQTKVQVFDAEARQRIETIHEQERAIKSQLDSHLATAVDKRDYEKTIDVLRGELDRYVSQAEFAQFQRSDAQWKADTTAALRDIQSTLRQHSGR